MESRYPQKKLTIVGGGIIGAMEAYFAYLDAKKEGRQVRVTIHEKNKSISETTASNIAPSLTPDEIISVVPRGPELEEKLGIPFNKPRGVRVDDVDRVNGTVLTKEFIQQVQEYSKDEAGHEVRTKVLLELGKMSMKLWQEMYDEADTQLREILEQSSFNPCREPKKNDNTLRDGYRIDLIYKVPNAKAKAEGMKADYENLGYRSCKILSPKEVIERDPYLRSFCESNSIVDEFGERHWKNDAVALWRPGGCIDTRVFLPKFYAYLKSMMGQYVNEQGVTKDCFQLRLEREVRAVDFHADSENRAIVGLRFFGKEQSKQNMHQYEESNYVFCPGERVGTLRKFGFKEPAYAGFAGASLKLNISLPPELHKQFKEFFHCMEVHQEGVVLAWRAKLLERKIIRERKTFLMSSIVISVAGTKAYYSDQTPNKDQAFAKDRNLLQLNMVNDVLPECISLALGRDTKGQKLTEADLGWLEKKGVAEYLDPLENDDIAVDLAQPENDNIEEDLDPLENEKMAKRWVGTRAVAYDGFPTVGFLFNQEGKVPNARCTTHLGSGGVSFGPGAVVVSRHAAIEPIEQTKQTESDQLIQTVLNFGRSNRCRN